MITLFDLRSKEDTSLYADIQACYSEPLNIVPLFDKTLQPCIGCWDCWLKTPGVCFMKDDMVSLYADYMQSRNVIILMDTAQGFINHRAKAFIDRSIVHYLPYIELIQGECHHVARYKTYPDLTFYFDSANLSDKEEQVIEDYLYRTAFHYKGKGFRLLPGKPYTVKPLAHRKPKNKSLQIQAFKTSDTLIIYNGSPRRANSNSGIILEALMRAAHGHVEIRDLKKKDLWETWQATFATDQKVMFFLPLYVHAMPSHVMAFIEGLKPSEGSLSFFIQSGFPESSQSYFLEAYFELLAQRLQRHYGGTAIKGGMEGLQMRPAPGQVNMVRPLVKAIQTVIEHGAFNEEELTRLATPVRFGLIMRVLFRLIGARLMNRFFWNMKLKKNNAYAMRFNRPHSSKTP
ncbi:MAG: hypothetical protein EA374_06590 [Acholeplasmatales bacterium]|nr:MAG: hypothetical protein EA374_06590 [Acholeplasmatales bacterium]